MLAGSFDTAGAISSSGDFSAAFPLADVVFYTIPHLLCYWNRLTYKVKSVTTSGYNLHYTKKLITKVNTNYWF